MLFVMWLSNKINKEKLRPKKSLPRFHVIIYHQVKGGLRHTLHSSSRVFTAAQQRGRGQKRLWVQ